MFKLIAGPCAIESEEMAMDIAEKMKAITDKLGIDYTFKGSFDKANRTSIHSKRGLGIDEGLRILQKVKNTYNIPVATDIHESWQAEPVGKVVDIVQIPAFLCRQTDLLVAAAKTGKCINIKKAQFLAPWDMKNCLQKVVESGNSNVMLCERGTSFGYNTLVVDMTGLVEMKKFGYPVILMQHILFKSPAARVMQRAAIVNMLNTLPRLQLQSVLTDYLWKLIKILMKLGQTVLIW